MAEERLRRKEMVENRSRLFNFCLTSGRDLFQDVLELETSPALVFNKLKDSDYYRTLSETEKESYQSLINQNTFSALELEQVLELLKRFTSVKQPKCLWCGQCLVDSLQNESIEECLELVMSIWNILKNSNFLTQEIYLKCVSSLRRIGIILSKKGAFGKSFRENYRRDMEENDYIHILSRRGDINVLIGNNNKSIINVEVFDHLPKEMETTEMEEDYLKLIIHLQSASGIDVARIEERMLLSLSGEQLQEINKIIEERFGLQIVVARKSCVVLVIEKNKLIFNSVKGTNILEEFLSELFKLIGYSIQDLFAIDISVDITKGDAMDKVLFEELNKKKKGFEIIVGPRKKIESMSEERRKEFVITILSAVQDQGDWDRNGDIKIQADFTLPTNESKNAIGNETLHGRSEREHAYVCDRLTPGQRYRVRIACCKVARGVKFFEPCGPVVPGQCQAPKLEGRPKATYLHIRWAYPDYDGGAAVSEYAVQMVTPDNTCREVYKGRDLDCIVTEVSPGRTYLFQVRAFNRVGGGAWSDPFEVVSGAGVPDPPKAPKVTCKSAYSTLVSWEPPVNNGATITEYRLEWQQKTEVTDFTMLYTGPNQSYEIKGLTPATLYLFRVQAINSIGQGPYSPLETCVTPPSSPSSVTIHRHTSTATSITLFWKEPNSNGSDITAYNLEVSDKHLKIGAVCKYTIETLKPDTVHKIRVQAVNAIGIGPFSTPVLVRTRPLPSNSLNLECVASTPNSLKLKWGDQRGLDTNHYTLEMEKEDGNFQVIYEGFSHFFKVKQLQETTNYNFRIYASNDVSNGPYSEVYTFSTTKAPLPAVRDPRVSNLCQESCSVDWQPCKAIPGSSVEYVLQLQGEHEFQEIYRGEDTSFQVECLVPKTDYHLRVCAIRIYEDGSEVIGPFSTVVTFTTQSNEPLCAQEANIKQKSKLLEREHLTDQEEAMIILMGFVVFAVLLSFVAQQIIKY